MPSPNSMSGRSGSWSPNKRVMAAGMIAGIALGAWATTRNHPPAVNAGEAPDPIDWNRARTIAIGMNRGQALTATERSRLDAEYRELVARCVPIVSAYTGDTLPATLERTWAFDRVDWINANIEGFRRVFEPIQSLATPLASGPGAALLGGVNRGVLSGELGVMLGYLARRVLGQYDLVLMGKEAISTGKLYFVEPNIRMVEEQLKLPAADFRMWLALHETTHAFEFEAHPWVRDHFNGLLERYFGMLREDAERLRASGLKGLGQFVTRARDGQRGEGSWIEAFMSPEQRELFAEMQAMMCMVEGYSNHVMNAVGKDLLPTYAEIARKFELRQQQKSPAEQFFAKLTGLDVKLEQYRLGEQFIDAIVRRRGHEAARRVWEGPEFLPNMEEIRDPDRWLARIDARDMARARG
jgi:coenzyme F420 biosynthesis associated uncharacterized protein